MQKNASSAVNQQANMSKGIKKYLVLTKFSVVGRDAEADMDSYMVVLPKEDEQRKFHRLCQLVDHYSYNSFDFTTLQDIGTKIGELNRTRLKQLLIKFEELELIKDLTEKGIRRIYINPKYFTKSLKLSQFVLDMFDCEYTDSINTKKEKPKVNRNPEKEENIFPFWQEWEDISQRLSVSDTDARNAWLANADNRRRYKEWEDAKPTRKKISESLGISV